jgi:MoxR-like ATPase
MAKEFDQYSSSKKTATLAPYEPSISKEKESIYLPSKGLADAVNVALALGQPLLLTGEPGTGKTQLAYHLAAYFGLGEPEIYPAQTNSTASDLFYRYDALGHFQYAQNGQNAPLSPDALEQGYIRYNALGRAIRSGSRRVVLIDEIDKAPRDLPNDLLLAIEKLRFSVPEVLDVNTGNAKTYETDKANRPVIILTSNSEKNLPDAFLRRVVYYHISFEEIDLKAILREKTGISPAAVEKVETYFLQRVRAQKLKKLPATAELIAWVLLLQQIGFPLEKLGSKLDDTEKAQIHLSFSVLAKNRDDLREIKNLEV